MKLPPLRRRHCVWRASTVCVLTAWVPDLRKANVKETSTKELRGCLSYDAGDRIINSKDLDLTSRRVFGNASLQNSREYTLHLPRRKFASQLYFQLDAYHHPPPPPLLPSPLLSKTRNNTTVLKEQAYFSKGIVVRKQVRVSAGTRLGRRKLLFPTVYSNNAMRF